MQYFLLYVEQHTSTQAGAASYGNIAGLIGGAVSNPQAPCSLVAAGAFIGQPRVTRQASYTWIFGVDRTTRVAWLFGFPDQLDHNTIPTCVKDLVDLALAASGEDGWQASQILPYDPGANGSVDWWQSGQASQTQTQTAFNLTQQSGATNTIENPVGPTQTASTIQQPTLGGSILGQGSANPIEQTTTLLKWSVGLLVIGTVAWMTWPMLTAKRAVRMNPRRRSNPIRRGPADLKEAEEAMNHAWDDWKRAERELAEAAERIDNSIHLDREAKRAALAWYRQAGTAESLAHLDYEHASDRYHSMLR